MTQQRVHGHFLKKFHVHVAGILNEIDKHIMPAPTALIRAPEKLAEEEVNAQNYMRNFDEDEGLAPDADNALETIPNGGFIDTGIATAENLQKHGGGETQMEIDTDSRPNFKPEKKSKTKAKPQTRKVIVPSHRMSPLKSAWPKIYPPLVQHLKLQVRMNPSRKIIEMRTSHLTEDNGALQKGEDFCKAFCLVSFYYST